MSANSSNAFLTSLTLHSVAAGLIIFFTYYSVWRQGPPPVIFELVAGPPTAPDELVAPALGNSPTPVKNEAKVEPKAEPKAEPKPEPPVETVQAVETPPEVTEVPKITPKVDKAMVSQMKKEIKKREKMNYKDYLKKHPIPKRAPQVAATTSNSKNVPRIDTEGIAQGVKGGSTANKRGGGGGKALTREEQNEFDTYISFLVSALKEAYVAPPGKNDKLSTVITFDITASGAILNPRITKSSGDREYDDSVLDAFRRVRSIGPTPSGKGFPNFQMAMKMSEEN